MFLRTIAYLPSKVISKKFGKKKLNLSPFSLFPTLLPATVIREWLFLPLFLNKQHQLHTRSHV